MATQPYTTSAELSTWYRGHTAQAAVADMQRMIALVLWLSPWCCGSLLGAVALSLVLWLSPWCCGSLLGAVALSLVLWLSPWCCGSLLWEAFFDQAKRMRPFKVDPQQWCTLSWKFDEKVTSAL